jgi:KDO2-lipid IV(A) lauroyltransferase
MRYWLEYIPFITVAGLVRLLPRAPSLALGRGLGDLARHLQPKRVRIADDNLRHAFPAMPDGERTALVKRVFRNLGQGFVEMLRLDLFQGSGDLHKLFNIEGEEHLREALGHGRGCILLTGHIGFWEAGAFIFPMLGIPLELVAKPMKNTYVDRYFRRMRQAYGCSIIDSRKGARRIFKALQNNHLVGILMDQHMSRSQAVRVPFFGRPAYTTPIIAQIAMKYRVPVLPAFAYRESDDTYRIVIEPALFLSEELSDSNIVANTAMLTEKIEAGIRRDIGQWFWVHRRWKHMTDHDA